MARSKKTGLDYFPFDVDFFQDEKIVCISGEFGLKGEICTIKLLCAVYRNGYFAVWDEKLRSMLLHALPTVSSELLEQIVIRLVRWGVFEKSLFDSAKVLTSRAIQRRYFQITRGRLNGDFPYLLIEDKIKRKSITYEETPISYEETPISYEEIPERKENILLSTTKCAREIEKVDISPPQVETSAPPRLQNPQKQEEQWAKEVLQDQQWIELIAMQLKIPPNTVRELLKDFILDNQTATPAKWHEGYSDFRNHFKNWLPYWLARKREFYQNEKQNNGQTRATNNGAGNQKRRGASPSNDFTDTF